VKAVGGSGLKISSAKGVLKIEASNSPYELFTDTSWKQ